MQISNRFKINFFFGLILLTIIWLQFVVSSTSAGILSITLVFLVFIVFNIFLNKTNNYNSSRKNDVGEEIMAFNDSVSHDLRAPLHAIMGFTQIILEDHGEELTPECKALLAHVVNANNKMKSVIDGLLALSKYTRTELLIEEVNLSALAQEIVEKLKQLTPDRRVHFSTQENLKVFGDSKLLRVVMSNLINNAFKFTSHQTEAFIEFGMNDGVYFLRDNGVGFDKRHIDKLFRAFQRLHATREFPGLGLGLTNVQQIIQRHNGKIWAEAELQQGATFFFTIKRNTL